MKKAIGTINRTIKFKIYPSKTQEKELMKVLDLNRWLYNACLEQRIDAHKKGIALNYFSQSLELTKLRDEDEEYSTRTRRPQQDTLKRLDLAYQSFFRRVKKGEKEAGFPKFKSGRDYNSFSYSGYVGAGWKFSPGDQGINGRIALSKIGPIKARGRGRFTDEGRTTRDAGEPKVLTIMRDENSWYATIIFETPTQPFRKKGDGAIGVDWGVSKFLTGINEKNETFVIENPRHLKKFEERLALANQNLSSKKKGSKNRNKSRILLNRIYKKLKNIRKNFIHKSSAKIVGMANLIASEELDVKSMTKKDSGYKNLTKSILDTAPGMFFDILKYKAEEAGVEYIKVPTKKIKPSQSCAKCGAMKKKLLSERVHDCECGFVVDRDVNESLIALNYALTGYITVEAK